MIYIFPLCDGEALLYDFVKWVANLFQVFELTDIYFSSFRKTKIPLRENEVVHICI